MLAGRTPLGLISDIASWNYPYSVLMHAVLVQALAGNAVIAKTPTDGGLFSLTIGFALARRCGLPVSLVSGSGGALSEALLVDNPDAPLPGQDISAYLAPISLLNVPRNCRLHHNEPFGPIDSIVVVDRIEELISEMNISNGNLVSSIACDDPATAREIASELRSFKEGLFRRWCLPGSVGHLRPARRATVWQFPRLHAAARTALGPD